MQNPPPAPQQQQQITTQSVILQLQQAAQNQPQQPPQPPSTQPGGVTTTQKHSSDGDEQYRNAKRRKPTSLSLPTHFTPTITSTSPSALGPTDLKLSTSLESLDHLSSSYRTLQSLEHKLDWTFSRKAIELQEPQGQGQGGEERGERRERKLTIWVQANVIDQEWQLTSDQEGELEKAGEVPQDEATQVKVPRVEFEIKGKILYDDSQSKIPFTSYFQQIQISSPLLSSPITYSRSTTSPPPSSLRFTIPLSCPPTLSIPLTLLFHPYTYSSSLFTLPPTTDLSNLLQLTECTRRELLHNLWLYIRQHKLIIEGGIKLEDETKLPRGLGKRFFGGSEVVGWHHLGEYANRWLGPIVPRKIECEFKVSESEPMSQIQAFEFSISYFPSSQTSTSPRSRQQLSQILSSLSPSQNPSTPLTSQLSSLNSQISLSTLSVQTHLLQLHSLLSFTRDPTKFLSTYLGSLQSDLSLVLNKEGRGSSSMGFGEGWKENLRNTKEFLGGSEGQDQGGWIREAASVLLNRDQEGSRIRSIQQQMGGSMGGGQQVNLNPARR
ncbi:hypothetical protein JCM5353_008298 [Sporobolomyces roseus]